MDTALTFSLMQPGYFTFVPAIVFGTFAVLLIAALHVPGAKADHAAKAIGCYIMKAVGILMIAMSVLPLAFNLMSGVLPEMNTVSSLLVVFLIGAGIITHFSRVLTTVDSASALVPRLVFSHGFEIIGTLIVLVSALSLMLSFVLTQQLTGWEMPATTFLLGALMMLMFSMHISVKRKETLRMKIHRLGSRRK